MKVLKVKLRQKEEQPGGTIKLAKLDLEPSRRVRGTLIERFAVKLCSEKM